VGKATTIVVRRPKSSPANCCAKPFFGRSADSKFCLTCGVAAIGTAWCSGCKDTVEGKVNRFCGACGLKLTRKPGDGTNPPQRDVCLSEYTAEQRECLEIHPKKIIKALANCDSRNSPLKGFRNKAAFIFNSCLNEDDDGGITFVDSASGSEVRLSSNSSRNQPSQITDKDDFMSCVRGLHDARRVLHPSLASDCAELEKWLVRNLDREIYTWRTLMTWYETKRRNSNGTAVKWMLSSPADHLLLAEINNQHHTSFFKAQHSSSVRQMALSKTSKATRDPPNKGKLSVQFAARREDDTPELKKIRQKSMNKKLCIDFGYNDCDEFELTDHGHLKTNDNGSSFLVYHFCAHCGRPATHSWMNCPEK
jgi:hypothetical protein